MPEPGLAKSLTHFRTFLIANGAKRKYVAIVIARKLTQEICHEIGKDELGRQMRAFRKRSEFAITETELKLIAAAAIIGLSNRPKNGYRTPAAIGTPIEL